VYRASSRQPGLQGTILSQKTRQNKRVFNFFDYSLLPHSNKILFSYRTAACNISLLLLHRDSCRFHYVFLIVTLLPQRKRLLPCLSKRNPFYFSSCLRSWRIIIQLNNIDYSDPITDTLVLGEKHPLLEHQVWCLWHSIICLIVTGSCYIQARLSSNSQSSCLVISVLGL